MALSAACPAQLQQAACTTTAGSSRLLVARPCVSRQQRQRPGVALAALSAGAAGGGALAIYSWPKASKPVLQQPVTRSPTRLWTTQMWFEAMVQTVVKQLDGGAFLLRVKVNPVLSLQLVRLDPADLEAGWEHIQQRHLSSVPLQQDEALILVHPVAAADRPCVVRQTAGEACPGCPHTLGEVSAAAAASAAAYGGGVTASFAAAAAAAAAAVAEPPMELMQGRFGDCCSGSGDHSHHHHHGGDDHSKGPRGPQQQQQQQQHLQQQACETQTAFYGLVVQTRDASDPLQGCYLLKTMKQSSSSNSSECHCTHYSLNQVCKGPSLHQQYQASWLV